jgi:nitrite reductase/ring-hydroxylating ferredoxin subunit
MATMQHVSRRSVLAGAGAGAGLVLVAACSSGSPGPGGTSGSGAGATLPPGETLAPLADVPVGGAVVVTVGGRGVVVSRPAEGEARAFSAVCTHQGCTVAADGGQLACPCHGSRFDAATGAVVQGPAQEPLPEIAVAVQGGEVVTA